MSDEKKTPAVSDRTLALQVFWNQSKSILIRVRSDGIVVDYHDSGKLLGDDLATFKSLADCLGAKAGELLAKKISECQIEKAPTIVAVDITAKKKKLHFLIEIIPFDAKESAQFLLVFNDVTSDRRTREALQTAKDRFETIIDSSPSVLALYRIPDLKPDGTPTHEFFPHYVSKNCESMTGYTHAEILADPDFWNQQIHPDTISLRDYSMSELLKKKKTRCEYQFKKKSGEWIIIDELALPSGDQEAMIYWSDITSLRESENLLEQERQKLVHASRLGALGEMASGIAHEINNPLAVIQGKAQLVQARLKPEKLSTLTADDLIKTQGDFDKIIGMVHRVSTIIKGLRRLSTTSESEPLTHYSLNLLIDETLALCQAKYQELGIQIKLECPQNLSIPMRHIQISQVLINLLNNSQHAVMRRYNQLKAEKKETNSSDKWIQIQVQLVDKFVVIKVSDSGGGIPDEVSKKLFQPFYTTKDVGEGTGIGLSISKGIIEDHKGSLAFTGNKTFTEFTIQLLLG